MMMMIPSKTTLLIMMLKILKTLWMSLLLHSGKLQKIIWTNFTAKIGNPHPVALDLDVKTRWNSTLTLVQKALRLKDEIDTFLHHLTTASGKKEFNRVDYRASRMKIGVLFMQSVYCCSLLLHAQW